MRSLILVSVLFVPLALASPAAGAVQISFDPGPISMQAGGTTAVNVWIASDSADNLASFGFQFEIDFGGSASPLQFIDPQHDLQLSSSAYVFGDDENGDSLPDSFAKQVSPLPDGSSAVANVSGAGSFGFNKFLTGGDFTADDLGFPFNVPLSSEPKLLVTLELEHLTPGPVGEFTLTLLDTGGFTYFQSEEGEVLEWSNPGVSTTIMVVQATEVIPEPGSLTIWGLSTLAAALGLLSSKSAARHSASALLSTIATRLRFQSLS